MQKFEKVTGNKECIGLLENYLAEARKGHVSFCGIFTVEGNRFAGDYTGDLNAFHVGFFASDYLQQKMRNLSNIEPFSIEDDSLGPPNKYVYDLNVEPVCHDFVPWLVTAKMKMVREGGVPPLRIAFIRGKKEQRRPTEAFFNNVMLPALKVFGAEHDPVSFDGRRLRVYACKEIVDHCLAGEGVPQVEVPEEDFETIDAHLKGDEPVTITLREAEGLPHRNSNVEAWLAFASWLQKRGERVIILRDTAKADEPLEGFETFPAGSRKVSARIALYERAKCNCFVMHGPQIWAQFGSRPWLSFVTIEQGEPSQFNTPAWWARYQGIDPGEQFPWSDSRQRIVYADDTFENLCAAWEETMEAKQVKAA